MVIRKIVKQDIFPFRVVACFLEFFSCPRGSGTFWDPFPFKGKEENSFNLSTNLQIYVVLWCAKYSAREYEKAGEEKIFEELHLVEDYKM